MQVAITAGAAGPGFACSGSRSPWRFLSVDEARTLAAICDQIIPPDQDPGAAWAGVVNYVDRQLCGPFKHLRRTYRLGIAGLNHSSLGLYGKEFVDLSPEKQVDMLTAVEKGQAPSEAWKETSGHEFFEVVLDHTMQGFYGDPRHGGNHDRASWAMLGVPYPPIRGRLHYDLTKA
jgi:gluconate 2-dehydrogenase gamma chain